jgi:hypothetical protein
MNGEGKDKTGKADEKRTARKSEQRLSVKTVVLQRLANLPLRVCSPSSELVPGNNKEKRG